jgi:hypothetical protein
LVRPQIFRRTVTNTHITKENEEEITETTRMRDHVWQNVISNIPEDKIDRGAIFNPTRQREWDEDQKSQGVITSLTDIDPVVFN